MILDDIVEKRKLQLEQEISRISRKQLERLAEEYQPAHPSFKEALRRDGMSFICEVKKASPSKGLISADFRPVETAEEYERSGAAAISCLTEEHYFQGSSVYLRDIASKADIPVLRKDFIFDEYQILEAKILGASAVLLIAAILSDDQLKKFSQTARENGLDCLTEVHNKTELQRVLDCGAEIVGINNRDLRTFNVSLKTTEELAGYIPSGKVIVSESGIKTPEDIAYLRSCGADAVLIGETLMRSGNISGTLQALRGGA